MYPTDQANKSKNECEKVTRANTIKKLTITQAVGTRKPIAYKPYDVPVTPMQE